MADIVPTRRPPARLAAFVLALAPLAACSFIADPSGARNDPRDAGAPTDSGAMEVDAGSDGGMSCALRSIPTAPTDVDDSDPEGLVVTLFAARDIALDSEVVD